MRSWRSCVRIAPGTPANPYSSNYEICDLYFSTVFKRIGDPSGTKGAAEFIKKRYESVKAKVEKQEGYFTKDQEKLRVVWIYGAPVFDFDIYEWSEREYGVLLMSQMNNNYAMNPIEDISGIDHILAG